MVEAAFLYPLVILLLAGVIRLSLTILEETKTDALRHREEAVESLCPHPLSVENVMRGVWILDE